MAVDLGKQIGPLPLGAWVVVVGAGLGIAYYTRRQGSDEPVEVEDGSVPPGVGTGEVGGWTPTTPGAATPGPGKPTTNEEWTQRAIDGMVSAGYNPLLVDSAVRKYIAGLGLSISESAIIAQVLVIFGSPPTPLPPVENAPPVNVPPGNSPPPATAGKPPAPGGMKIVAVGSTAVTVQWNVVSGANSYIAYRGIGGATTGVNVGNHTRYIWRGLKPRTTYYFSAASVKNGVRSGRTSSVIRVRTS